MDVIFNGQAKGSVAARLIACNMDAGMLRPFIGEDGGAYVSTALGQVLAANAGVPFTKDAWKHLDTQVIQAAQPRLRLVGDMRARGLQVSIPNGMGKTSFEYQDESDISDAEISMDPVVKTQQDRPMNSLKGIPLPVIHKDVVFSARQVAISRNGNGNSLDVSSLRLQTRKVADTVEKLAIGIGTPYTVGGGVIYGLTSFPQRLTKVLANPAGGTWTPQDTLDDVLDMKDMSQAAYHYGPWKIYCSPGWDKYMDGNFSASYPGLTLRQRLTNVENIEGVMTLDFLPGMKLMMVQMSDDCFREVIGMEVTPVQWEEAGGMEIHMKVMTIMIPNPRADFYDRTGIIDGSV